MKIKLKIVCAALIGFILGSLTVVGANQAIQAFQNDQIKVTMDGEVCVFIDELTGEIQYPISYNNRTYLPLRNLAQLLGIQVDYDDATKTAKLTRSTTKTTAQPTVKPTTKATTTPTIKSTTAPKTTSPSKPSLPSTEYTFNILYYDWEETNKDIVGGYATTYRATLINSVAMEKYTINYADVWQFAEERGDIDHVYLKVEPVTEKELSKVNITTLNQTKVDSFIQSFVKGVYDLEVEASTTPIKPSLPSTEYTYNIVYNDWEDTTKDAETGYATVYRAVLINSAAMEKYTIDYIDVWAFAEERGDIDKVCLSVEPISSKDLANFKVTTTKQTKVDSFIQSFVKGDYELEVEVGSSSNSSYPISNLKYNVLIEEFNQRDPMTEGGYATVYHATIANLNTKEQYEIIYSDVWKVHEDRGDKDSVIIEVSELSDKQVVVLKSNAKSLENVDDFIQSYVKGDYTLEVKNSTTE